MDLLQELFSLCRRRKPQSTATITPSESITLLPLGEHLQNMFYDVENVIVNGGTFIIQVDGMSSACLPALLWLNMECLGPTLSHEVSASNDGAGSADMDINVSVIQTN